MKKKSFFGDEQLFAPIRFVHIFYVYMSTIHVRNAVRRMPQMNVIDDDIRACFNILAVAPMTILLGVCVYSILYNFGAPQLLYFTHWHSLFSFLSLSFCVFIFDFPRVEANNDNNQKKMSLSERLISSKIGRVQFP